MTFAEKLRELRDAKGLSEAKLADASGIPFGTVHVYSLGRRKPSFAAVLALSKALGVTCEAFAECSDVAGEGAEPEEPATKKKPVPSPAPASAAPDPAPEPAPEPTAAKSKKPKGGKK